MRPSFLVVACCLVSFVSGCASDPGLMTQSEIEAKLKDTLHLKVVSLEARPEGGYLGRGQTADGTNYTITVDQKEADRSLWYTATTDKGELKAGGFQEFGPVWLRPLKQLSIGVKVILILFVVVGGGIVIALKLARRTKHAEPGATADGGGGTAFPDS